VIELESVVTVGQNPELDLSQSDGEGAAINTTALDVPLVLEGFGNVSLANAEAVSADQLGKSIVVVPGVLDFATDANSVLSLVSDLLDRGAPMAVVCVRESELATPVIAPDDEAKISWSFAKADKTLSEAGLESAWGGLMLTNRSYFERNHSVFLVTRDEALKQRLAQLMSTGIRSFTFAPGASTNLEHPDTRPARVAICTDEIFGPSSNGGIGTAYTAMAEFLAKGGHEVTVFFSGDVTSREPIEYWVEYYQTKNIRVIPLALDRIDGLPWQDEYLRRSFVVYSTLREAAAEQPFDAIHFPECNGQGFYAVLAKHQGLDFADTTLCIGTHGSTRWVYEGHGLPFDSTYQLSSDFMEQTCIRWCDVLVSPSIYLVYWMKREGWDLPDAWYGQQNLQPFTARGEDERREDPFPLRDDINELVFFGRLEARKGLVPFCDALDLIAASDSALPDFSVTFMGKEVVVEGMASRAYLEKRSEDGNWEFEWKIIDNFNQDKAVGYLQGDRRVAMIPSLQDNSPYTVLECIGLGIPFLSQRIGGIPELIDPRDVAQCTFYSRGREGRPREIAAAVRRILTTGIRAARRAVAAPDTDAGWVDFHSSIVRVRDAAEPVEIVASAPVALDAVVLVKISDTLKPILRCARSLAEQEPAPKSLRIALVEEDADEIAMFRERFAGDLKQAGFELIVGHGTGDGRLWLIEQICAGSDATHVLLAHTNTFAQQGELETFGKVLDVTGADFLTSFLQPYCLNEDEPDGLEKRVANYFPIGSAPLLPLFANPYGMGHIVASKHAVKEVLKVSGKALSPEKFGGMIALGTAHGFTHEVIPEYLVNYIQADPKVGIHVNDMPPASGVDSAMASLLHPSMRGLFHFLQGSGDEAAHIQSKIYELRYALQEEFPTLQQEHADQSKWLASREDELERTASELEKFSAEAAKYKKKADELKHKLREEELRKKLVIKDNEHLSYRLNRKLSHRIRRMFGGKKVEGKSTDSEG